MPLMYVSHVPARGRVGGSGKAIHGPHCLSNLLSKQRGNYRDGELTMSPVTGIDGPSQTLVCWRGREGAGSMSILRDRFDAFSWDFSTRDYK